MKPVKPSSKIFYRPLHSGTSFVDHMYYVCLVFVMLSRLFKATLWSPAGKGLTFWLSFVMFNCVFVTFLCGILVQVKYLTVSFPDLCHISYFLVHCLILIQSCFGGLCWVLAF